MKLFAFLSAGLVAAAAALTPVAASAQHHERVAVLQHDSRVVYRSHGGPRRWHTRQACTTRWHHGQRVRRCRTVRYR